MYGYKKPNAIKYEVQGGNQHTFQDALIFSDSSCDVFYTGLGEYELWVTEAEAKQQKVPTCCEFIFEYFALGKTIYNIYETSCPEP
ncbi:hypothetical protein MTO96_034658 [Rhipicephalus appendiculatus]|uniref:Lipocalin n=1 Tax=Rhipicephalus appendiculatus TaxID=34631 RepID=A0A131YRW4_RHIAP